MEEVIAKSETRVLSESVRYLFAMTDGVADDFYPPEEGLPGLIKAVPPVMAERSPDKALLDLVNQPYWIVR